MSRTLVCVSFQFIIIMRKIFLLTIALALFKISFSQEEINVLWLGNSYTYYNNLPAMVNELCKGTDKVVNHESVTPGGCTLFQHAVSQSSLSAIRKGDWDYVVLQEQSQLPSIDYYRHNAMRPAYQSLYDSIMLYNPDAMVVGYMTWGRQYGGQQCVNFGEGVYCSADFVDFNHMQDTMSVAYCENAYATDSYVAPVGDAWKAAFALNPELLLHSSDQSHPSYDGSYLAACVFYAVFFAETPVGTHHGTQIDAEKAEMLQTVAHDVVFNNLEKWNLDFVSLEENDCENNFQIINNPNSDSIIIKNINSKSAKVSVLNINGVLVKEFDITGDASISLDGLNGIYLIRIIEEDTKIQFVEKIVK